MILKYKKTQNTINGLMMRAAVGGFYIYILQSSGLDLWNVNLCIYGVAVLAAGGLIRKKTSCGYLSLGVWICHPIQCCRSRC